MQMLSGSINPGLCNTMLMNTIQLNPQTLSHSLGERLAIAMPILATALFTKSIQFDNICVHSTFSWARRRHFGLICEQLDAEQKVLELI